jgi:Ca-activated chloride channel family protein
MKTMNAQMESKTRQVLAIVTMMLVMSISGFAQSIKIQGTVLDEQSSPLPGVLVQSNEEPKVYTITDVSGHYVIAVSEKSKQLIFSMIGYKQEKVTIGNQQQINVTLQPDVTKLNEVITVGYGAKVNKKQKMPAPGHRSAIRYTPPVIVADAEEMKTQQEVSSITTCIGAVDYDKGSDDVEIVMEASPVQMPQNNQQFNTENYSAIHENGFKEVTKEPLSTFSVDVDKASYANVRRFLNSGSMPPADAVRIEEMINYFAYDYAQPTDNRPFAAKTDLAVCPWNNNHYLLKVGIKGKELDKQLLPPSNLVFLLDVSGSMEDANKLPLLKEAFKLLVNELRPSDRIAIVVYAGAAGIVLPSTPGNCKDRIYNALNNLQAGGSTAGGEGIKLAYKVANENFIIGGNNRIILATDGDFNIGESSNSAMEQLVTEQRDKGVFVTVLGFGMGNYKDDRMEIIADKGNGNYAYIDNLQEAQKTLVSEFGGTLFTIAKDVKLQLEFNPNKIAAYRLIGYENRLLNNEDFNDDKKDAGEIGAGHTVTALYELIPTGAPDAAQYLNKVDKLKYQQMATTSSSNEWLTLKLRYKEPDGTTSQLIEQAVNQKPLNFENADIDLQFAASVAGFGMLLRGSKYLGNLTFNRVQSMALAARGNDEDGYRSEMVRLVKLAGQLSPNACLPHDAIVR